MIDFPTLAKIITREFGHPFLPTGFVKAKAVFDDDEELRISIGPRDITIGNDGTVRRAGTDLSGQWEIAYRP